MPDWTSERGWLFPCAPRHTLHAPDCPSPTLAGRTWRFQPGANTEITALAEACLSLVRSLVDTPCAMA